MKNKNEFPEKDSRKDYRRKKLQDKNNHKDRMEYDDFEIKASKKRDVKKIKEDIQDEEWEDWDRYYNH